MIMRLMRKYFSYWVFAVLLVTLSIGLVSGGLGKYSHADAIMVVNGESIKYDHFSSILRSAEEDERARKGRELSDSETSKLRADTLEQLENEALALQGMKQLHLESRTEEIQQTIMSIPRFRDPKTGVFDEREYQKFLYEQMQRGQSASEIEDNIQRSLSLGKVQTFWRNNARVTPAEVEQGLRQMHRKAKARLIVWNYKDLQAKQQPTDDELHTYYSQNRDRWAKPEQVKARHILIKADALSGTTVAKAKADEIYKKAKAGADFAKLAGESSQDENNSKKGGDLGWISKGEGSQAFESKAFSLKAGEISEPVLGNGGWEIIKVDAKKPGFEPTFDNSKAKAKDGLTEELARKQARQEAGNAAAELAEGKDISAVAKELKGGALKETGWFKVEDKAALAGLGDTTPLVSQLLTLDKGQALNAPVSLEKGIVVGLLSDEQPGELVKDADKLQKRRGEVSARLHSEKSTALYDGWLKSLKAAAKIEDRTDSFYGGKKL